MDIDKAALLAEIIALTEMGRQQPNDITIADYVAATGVSWQCAQRRLRELCASGKLAEHKVQLDNGKMGYVYRAAAS